MKKAGGAGRASVGRRRWKQTASATAFWVVATLAQNAAIGDVVKTGEVCKTGENNASAALGENKEDGEGGESRDALERAFWETLARCESPILTERDAAEDALVERFAEFEPIWQERSFLTNGEIGAEARARFELAEARRREQAFEECVAAFEAAFEIDAPSVPEARSKGVGEVGGIGGNNEVDEVDGIDGNSEVDEVGGIDGNNEVGKVGEVGEARGRIRLRWEAPLRIVYLTPDWSAFERRDAAERRWRPSGRFSTPELAPEFDATELTVETVWERVETQNKENKGNKENSEDGGNEASGKNAATVAGLFEGLVGGDFRVWRLPLTASRTENGEDGENGETFDDYPRVFQSGDATATVGETVLKENGETTARVRLEFAETFDAFDSHRVWFNKSDFALSIEQNDKEDNDGQNEEAEWEDELKEAEPERTTGRRWEPIRLRARERSARGVLLEFDFPNEPTIRAAVEEGRARLECRVPRFFFWIKIPVAGEEKTAEERWNR